MLHVDTEYNRQVRQRFETHYRSTKVRIVKLVDENNRIQLRLESLLEKQKAFLIKYHPFVAIRLGDNKQAVRLTKS
jgi:hypothetical protein